MADTALMPIPGQFDPVPTPREVTPREDGRVDLIGLPRARITELFAQAGLDAKAAKLRAKQLSVTTSGVLIAGLLRSSVRNRPPAERARWYHSAKLPSCIPIPSP